MKKLFKRIISGVFALVTLFFACVPPAYASFLPNIDIDVDLVEFGDWVHSNMNQIGNTFWNFFDDNVCARSPNDNGLHNFVEKRTQVDGKPGLYYVCEYCGKSAGEVVQEAYDNYVSELPATGYYSDGSLFILAKHAGTSIISTDGVFTYSYLCPHYDLDSRIKNDTGANVSYNCANGTVEISLLPDSNSFWLRGSIGTTYFVECPIDGFYSYNFDITYSGSYVAYAGFSSGSFDKTLTYSDIPIHYSPGNSFEIYTGYTFSSSSINAVYFKAQMSCIPIVKVVPYASIVEQVSNIYNITTRPTTITGGNYGIVGDNGQITTVVDNSSIVNEVNNTYYNPATGQTGTITSWTYDYSSRSYNITLSTGDTVTATYGDKNITIVEGDTNYTIYYVIQGSGSGSGGNETDTPSHDHNWQQTSRAEPTCTAPGYVLYACTECSQTRREVLPATGHTWQIKRIVQTTYDDDGNLLQQGYAIYQCVICGEEYKDENDTGPPNRPGSGSGSDSDDVDDGGLIEWINGLIKALSDKLSGAVELILSFFQEIPGLFDGYLEFLSAMFPFLPEEIIMLLTFGIAAVVFIGIVKAIRR